jgi:hypothetical protein
MFKPSTPRTHLLFYGEATILEVKPSKIDIISCSWCFPKPVDVPRRLSVYLSMYKGPVWFSFFRWAFQRIWLWIEFGCGENLSIMKITCGGREKSLQSLGCRKWRFSTIAMTQLILCSRWFWTVLTKVIFIKTGWKAMHLADQKVKQIGPKKSRSFELK